MNRRRNTTPKEIPPGFQKGSSIDLAAYHSDVLAIDLAGRVRCIVGYRDEDQSDKLPYYSPCVAARRGDGRGSCRFVELTHGALSKCGFLRDDEHYKILDDKWLITPSGADSYFGVISRGDRQEDAELTRTLFGATRREIEQAATALAPIVGRQHHEMLRLPRTTFSKTRDNTCDVGSYLIPKNFPYIAFDGANSDWSHVSLYGFYRVLDFLCPPHRSSPVEKALLEAGIDKLLLSSLVENARAFVHPLLAKDFL